MLPLCACSLPAASMDKRLSYRQSPGRLSIDKWTQLKAELPSEPSSRALQCFSAPPARFINCLSLMHRQGHGQALAVQCPNPLCIPCWFQLSHYPRCRLTSPLTCLTTSSPDVRLCQQTGCICGSCSPEHVSRVLLVLAALLVPGKVGNTAARLSFHATRASDKTRSRALLG